VYASCSLCILNKTDVRVYNGENNGKSVSYKNTRSFIGFFIFCFYTHLYLYIVYAILQTTHTITAMIGRDLEPQKIMPCV